jgi:DNA-binding transcriptional LysR family regulator
VPTNVKVIQATDFVRATPEGQVNLEMAEQMLRDIADAGAGLEGFQVLVDTRQVSGALTATDLWRLADRLAHYRRTFGNKTAILCPAERFDHSRFFALCAENRGFNVQAFTDYEHAMEWLLEGEEVTPRREIY